MKLFIKISLLLLLPVFAKGQNNQKYLDSLHQALKTAANDTVRMDIYESLGWYYEEINRDSILFYSERILQLAKQLNQKLDEANALSMKGVSLLDLEDFPKSLESLMQALHIAQDPSSEKNTGHLPNTFTTPRSYRLSILGFTHMYMGDLYAETGNIYKQIPSYFETIKLADSIHDDILEGDACMQLGGAYLNLNKLDSALLLEQKALALFSNSNTYWKGVVYNHIGEIYFRKGNIDLAREAFFKAAQISEEQDNGYSLGPNYISLVHFYQAAKKTDSSLLFAYKALEAFKRLRQPSGISTADFLLSAVYGDQNNTDSSFTYLKLATALKDSLHAVKINKLNEFQNIGFEEQIRLKELEDEKIQTQNKIRTYGMLAGIVIFMVIAFMLYRNNRNRKKANELLQHKNVEIEQQKKNVEQTLTELKSTQAQLIQSEKMASLGELTAGIAHEIQNPLNFVNNFSEVSNELISEMVEEVDKGNTTEVKAIAQDVQQNLEKILHHGKRADSIVKGMLQHSRISTGQKEPTDINKLADECLRLSYHGLRAKDKSFNAEMKTYFDSTIEKINIVPQDISRVLINLLNNAFYAVSERRKVGGVGYEPTVSVSTKKIGEKFFISVKDNGNGIPQKIVDKIFQPFFTTKT